MVICSLFKNKRIDHVFASAKKEGRGNGGMEGIHNEELNDLYSSPIDVREIKSRRMR